MKKRYKREAFLLDEDILLHGYKDKRGFHPDHGIQCGFGLQIIRRKDIGSILFYSLEYAVAVLGEIIVCYPECDKMVTLAEDGKQIVSRVIRVYG